MGDDYGIGIAVTTAFSRPDRDMNTTNRHDFEMMRETRAVGLFFRCPVGGFASLIPGACPKCGERLTSIDAAQVSTGQHTATQMMDAAAILESRRTVRLDGRQGGIQIER